MSAIGVLKLIDNGIKPLSIISIVDLKGDKNIYKEYAIDSPNLWRDILSLRYDFIYCWDTSILFAYLDAWADKEKLYNYADIGLNSNGYKAKCDVEAISYKDGQATVYQRKLWLKTSKAGSTDRHKRLSATSFINFQGYFNGLTFEKLINEFKIENNNQAVQLASILMNFNKFIKNITGMDFIKSSGAPLSWTMGGIAKAYYLKLYAPNSNRPAADYAARNVQSKAMEYTLRNANLLLPGILYMKDRRIKRNCFKFDKNSLFPAAEKNCPFLGIPREVHLTDVKRYKDNSSKYEIIYIFKNLTMSLKPGMIPIFKSPTSHYDGHNTDTVFLEEQAFFSFYLELISEFYTLEFEEVKAFVMLKTTDKAITKYVDTLYDFKIREKKRGGGLYTVVKYLLNNLHGKFAQLTLNDEFTYNRNKDGIIIKQVKSVSDNWEKSHFDYIRGAWVYAKSQAIMLEDLLALQSNGYNLQQCIYYIDTDCLVTSLSSLIMPVDDIELGAYKMEACFLSFKSYAPKIYAGFSYSDSAACNFSEFQLTCAGRNKKEIKDYLYTHFCFNRWYSVLNTIKLPNTIWKRTPTGCERVTEYIKLLKPNKDRSKSGVIQ